MLSVVSWYKQAWILTHAISEFLFLKCKRPEHGGNSSSEFFHSSQLMLRKYSPSLADWDISASYAVHTKDVKEVGYFLVEFKSIRFRFSLKSNCIYEVSCNLNQGLLIFTLTYIIFWEREKFLPCCSISPCMCERGRVNMHLLHSL